MDHYLGVTSDFDPSVPDYVCDECRSGGAPKIPTFELPRHHIAMINAWFEAEDPKNALREAAAASGLKQSTIKAILAGKRAPATRRAFQFKLEEQGLGPAGIATIMGDASKATQMQWNKAEQRFDEFPDHRTRLMTVKLAGVLQELTPPKPGGARQVNQIVIKTNLGTSGEPVEADPPSRFRPRNPEEVVDIDPN